MAGEAVAAAGAEQTYKGKTGAYASTEERHDGVSPERLCHTYNLEQPWNQVMP
jgi:hypothetical protein